MPVPNSVFKRQWIALPLLFFSVLSWAAETGGSASCTDRAECWPEGSAMYTGWRLVEKGNLVGKALERSHRALLAQVSATRSADGTIGTDGRLLAALETQHAAWLIYRDAECELVGSLTGSGGSWPSTYASQCAVNHLEQRLRRVRSARRCIGKLPVETRVYEQNNCLQQLAPLSNGVPAALQNFP
jgi:uncharacterized protein YecT (DUF1311 family)